MKLYVGSRNFKPEGYLTVDIDPNQNPDIVADITDMVTVQSGSVDEVVAGHVLEHINWPDAFKAFSEFARVLKVDGVLKVAVPDMAAMMRMMLSGDSAFHVMGIVFGVGGRINRHEQHRYGYTPGMLIDILETLGFGEFQWWNSTFADASNGWVPRWEDDHTALSLNIAATKLRQCEFITDELYEELTRKPLSDFLSVAAKFKVAHSSIDPANVPRLYQQIHFQLIEARQRIKYLEDELAGAQRT